MSDAATIMATWVGPLTHWCRDKMAEISQTTYSKTFSWKTRIWINISLNFVPEEQLNDIAELVQIMAWHRLSAKPLSDAMMVILLTQYASLSLSELINVASKHNVHKTLSGIEIYSLVWHFGKFPRVIIPTLYNKFPWLIQLTFHHSI